MTMMLMGTHAYHSRPYIGPFKTLRKVILASKSPRRRVLLEGLGIKFQVIPSNVPEPDRARNEPPEDYALRTARLKARSIYKRLGEAWIIAADSIVMLDDKVMGKPRDRATAIRMLMQLCGRCHTVYTGCWIAGPKESGYSEGFVSTSNVWLSHIAPELVRAYVDTGEPLGKAGGYAIQGIGAFMVKRIEGSYTNVIGLPLAELIKRLLAQGVIEVRGKNGPA